MKSAWLHIRGLNDSDPNGTWCGARAPAEAIAKRLGVDLSSANHDDADIEHAVDRLRAQGYYFIAIGGHSHGSDKARRIAERYGREAMDFLALIDDCPPESLKDPLAPLVHLGPALPFPEAARFGAAFWQRNMEPLAGCKFIPRDGVICEDVTGWTSPRLGHIDFGSLKSIAGDSRVWAKIEIQLATALQARQYIPAAPVSDAQLPPAILPPSAPAADDAAGAHAGAGGGM